MAARYRVIGSDGREVGVYHASELAAFKAQAIKSVDEGLVDVEVFTVAELEGYRPENPSGWPGRVVASQQWAASDGLHGDYTHTKPKARTT